MARKRVAVLKPHSHTVTHHVTHSKAFLAVANKKAEWFGPGYAAIRLFDHAATPIIIPDSQVRGGGRISLAVGKGIRDSMAALMARGAEA